MIIATIAALTILFSGGYEIFFIENVEKGIKEYVIEKDRRSELLALTKEAKSLAKDYNKTRNSKYKDFKTLYTAFSTSEDQLNAFFDDLTQIQGEFQQDFMKKRVEVAAGITDQEWDEIAISSKAARQKKIDKAAKKSKKDKEVFLKTKKAIAEIEDTAKKEIILTELEKFTSDMMGLVKSIEAVNVHESELLVKKSSSESELLSLYDEINVLRSKTFESIVSFHSVVKENLDAETGEPLLETFYKDLEITAM